MTSTQETRLVQGILDKYNEWVKQFDTWDFKMPPFKYPSEDVKLLHRDESWFNVILAVGVMDDGGPAMVFVRYEMFGGMKENVVTITMIVQYFDTMTNVVVSDPKVENGQLEQFDVELGEE